MGAYCKLAEKALEQQKLLWPARPKWHVSSPRIVVHLSCHGEAWQELCQAQLEDSSLKECSLVYCLVLSLVSANKVSAVSLCISAFVWQAEELTAGNPALGLQKIGSGSLRRHVPLTASSL